jgi:predicted permease
VIFLGAAILLLILAGTNAANLLIVRGLERDGELSLRRALGAGRRRLAGNLIAESVFLALAGGLIGLGMAVVGVATFKKFGPQSLPRMNEVSVNLRIVVAGVLLSVAVGVVVGLIPAIRSSGADLLTNLRASLTAFSPRGTRLRTTLASMQLALALILGVGASLLFRSFIYLRTERLGFEPRGLATMTVAFKKQNMWQTWDQVLGIASGLPGVTTVAAASAVPFENPRLALGIAPAELPTNAPIASVSTYVVSPTFFSTAKIPIVLGRAFGSTDRSDSKRVAIVNQRFAAANFGDRNPIGRTIRVREDQPNAMDIEIVGVVGDVVQTRVEDGMLPAVYMPHTQMPAMMVLTASTRRDPEDLARDLRRALGAAGLWSAPVIGVSSAQSRIDKSLAAPRFQLLLIAAFAGTAVLLAAIGLYGTLAFTVRSRTRELGIRLAMGATQRQIFDLVLRQGFHVLAIGMTVGVIGSLALTSLLRGFLYRVSPLDPTAFLAALVLVAAAVLVAAVRPARRAASVDPIASIRAP